MTDAQLKSALEQAIGIMGGRSATKSWPAASYGGAGLKIWVGWEWPGEKKPPTFAGLTTVALARQIYGIRDPEERQHSLL